MEVAAILISLIGITSAVVLALKGGRQETGQVARSVKTCQTSFSPGQAGGGGLATHRAAQ